MLKEITLVFFSCHSEEINFETNPLRTLHRYVDVLLLGTERVKPDFIHESVSMDNNSVSK